MPVSVLCILAIATFALAIASLITPKVPLNLVVLLLALLEFLRCLL